MVLFNNENNINTCNVVSFSKSNDEAENISCEEQIEDEVKVTPKTILNP